MCINIEKLWSSDTENILFFNKKKSYFGTGGRNTEKIVQKGVF